MTTEVKTNTNKRFFDLDAAAVVLLALTNIDALDRELEKEGIVAAEGTEEKDRTMTYLKSQGIATQGHFAAVVINFTIGEKLKLTPTQLTAACAKAFPNANVKERHGPHYLSHARHGRLTGLRADLPVIPHAKRKSKPKSEQESDIELANDVPEITAELLMAENSQEVLVDMAKSLGIKATMKWKVETVAAKLVEVMTASDEPAKAEEAA